MAAAFSSPGALAQEIETYNRERKRLLAEAAGWFVLIHGTTVIGTYGTQDEALAEGARQFGLNSFLVRPIQEAEPEVRMPALTLGLLNADTRSA